MITYDDLVNEIDVLLDDRADLPSRFKGLYLETRSKKFIMISKYITSECERKCVLAEEIGHYHKTVGNIFNQRIIENKKQEEIARRWAYEKLVPVSAILEAYRNGVRNRFEFSEMLGISEDFLEDALNYYKSKYGLHISLDDKVIYLDPLNVFE
ncbi:hypothetical protein BBD41_03360 [Paenibacillus ihbetae]|uniref:IrrE N-terminal-like domain-containing protein n=1 Tax=Paenibacillus ihbetae TaxID=1870820 RepID=A0A1B2DVF0_9BACL|nr:ImmA/IrrE family metallo-endopeptidase [Paenibacillus ihbetae]ANY71696.1 hypothetical protein BBD41_03360 [Paenibacillus ihbetae]